MKRRLRLLGVVMFMSVLTATACEKEKGASLPDQASAQQGGTYPIQTDVTLGYWTEINSAYTGTISDYNKVPFFQELQKKTGISLKFTQVPTGRGNEALSVMLASGELPDLIETNWLTVPGGPQKMINDGYIKRLNELIDRNAPNVKKYLQEHPEVDKMVKTDKGDYYVFPFLRGSESLQTYQGPIVRKDWLDELGLPVPETMDDWHTMLKAFKEKKGAAAPLSFAWTEKYGSVQYGAFVGAYGVNKSFYLDGGQVKFGPAQPAYKQFLKTFREWYAEGLLDKNFATADAKAIDANIAGSATGATIGNAGGGIGKWTPLVTAKDPKANLVGAPYPVLNKGDTPKFGQKDYAYPGQTSVAISGQSKNAELAVKMLDYGFGEAGHMLYNFGTEGVSYNLVNGYPKFTELIMNNPDKLSPAQAMPLYLRGSYGGPFVQDIRYLEQYYVLQQQKDAIRTWSTDADKYVLPPVSPKAEESTEMARIMTDINTLVDEVSLKIILGAEPLDYFDKFVQQLQSLHLDRAIKIQQAALDRYNKR